VKLTSEQSSWLDGNAGPSLQWAVDFNKRLGEFFGAEMMTPVESVHFAPDIRAGGKPCLRLLSNLVENGDKIVVPGTLDPCMVDFTKEAEWISEYGVAEANIQEERELQRLCLNLGFRPTYTCINYQSINPPRFGDSLAWGDTGSAICANALFGARTNFEGGPSALASALMGCTPAYGMHLDVNRRATLVVKLECSPREIADWGAIAKLAGSIATGYESVPVFYGNFPRPTFDMLKQLGVALASYGGHAMFHVVGETPEAATIEQAIGKARRVEEHVMTPGDLEGVFESYTLPNDTVDLVVFSAPQLSINEVRAIAELLNGRRVHEHTKLIIGIDPQVKMQADAEGVSKVLLGAGAEYSTGTCFYPESPWLVEQNGWRSLVTNSAKLVNTMASVGLTAALCRLNECIDAAVAGRLTQ